MKKIRNLYKNSAIRLIREQQIMLRANNYFRLVFVCNIYTLYRYLYIFDFKSSDCMCSTLLIYIFLTFARLETLMQNTC